MSIENAKRLGQLVKRRRVQLCLQTGKALADAAHLTPRVISDIEVGRRTNFSGSTKAAIEDKLLWEVGSIDAILSGGDPTPLAPMKVDSGSAAPPSLVRNEIEHEFVAMQEVASAVENLDPDSRSRVLHWALDRYVITSRASDGDAR